MKKLLLIMIICFGVLQILSLADAAVDVDTIKQEGNTIYSGVQNSIGNFNPYEWISNKIRAAKEQEHVQVTSKEQVVIYIVDLIISFLCTWFALWTYTMEAALSKKYLWFLVSFNILGVIFLLGFQVCWEMLSYLVIRLQPDLSEGIQGGLCLIMIVSAIGMYIWLLARNFNLQFFGAARTFFISHALYAVLIAVFFMMISPGEKTMLGRAGKNLGFESIIQSYVSDLHTIVTHEPLTSLVRIRAYHL